MQPICVDCQILMRCEKNDYKVGLSKTSCIYGDMYICPECASAIVVGFGKTIDAIDYPKIIAEPNDLNVIGY